MNKIAQIRKITPKTTIVIWVKVSVPLTIFSQEALATTPKITNTVFHIREPMVVNNINIPNFIFAIPAGMDIKLRTMGIHLQNKTVLLPLLLNQSQALNTSSFLKCNI